MTSELARAKLNLGLAVTTRRGDGYHELDTIFALIGLADVLEAAPADELRLRVETAAGLPGAELLGTAEDGSDPAGNLVLRAAEAYMHATGCDAAAFTLTKRIPVAAGLGGGSADAAAALRLMTRMHPPAAPVDLQPLALRLGADVPFMLSGMPAAHGRGRGERLAPLELPRRAVVLANPGVTVSAAEAYGELQNYSRRLKIGEIVTALEERSEPRWLNALQSGVVRTRPAIRQALSELRAEGLAGVLLSGSGATCFGIAEDETHAAGAVAAIRARNPGWWLHADVLGGD